MRNTTTALTLSILLFAGCSGEAPKPVETPPAPITAPAEPPAAESAPSESAPALEATPPEAAPSGFEKNAPEGSWRLVAFGDAVEVGEVEVTLDVRVDGSIGGRSGCNPYAGAWTVEGDRAHIGPLAGTKMACPTPQMEIETRYLREMEKAVGWRPHVDGIVLVDAAGDAILVFEKG